MNINRDNNKKYILIIVAVITIISLSLGGTYAYYTWAVNDINMSGTNTCFDIIYNKGGDIGTSSKSEHLIMSPTYVGGLSTGVSVKIKDGCDITGIGTIYLNTDSTVSDVLINSGALKYHLSIFDYNKPEAEVYSTIDGVVNTKSPIPIYNNFTVSNKNIDVDVFVWLDQNLVTDANKNAIFSSSYKGNISMKVESR